MARILINGDIVSFMIVKPMPTVETYMVEMWVGSVITPIYWFGASLAAAQAFIPKCCLTCVENKDPKFPAFIEEWY